jgi:predicted Zn-dependent peptidase
MYFYLSGLEENFDKGVAILEDLINNPKADKAVLTTMVDNLLKSRQDNLINKDVMMSERSRLFEIWS